MAKMIYNVEDKPTLSHSLSGGFQHLLSIIGATILVPILIGLPNQISAALLGCGLGSITYILITKKKSPVIISSNFAFIGALSIIYPIDGWEKFAIRLANQGYKVDITGSNAKMLSKEVEAELGGRYISKEIMPYSFSEFLKANGIEKNGYSVKEIGKVNSLLNQYFINGGFPESLLFVNKREHISNIYQKVLYNDIIVHNNIRNENGIKLMIKKVAESLKQDLSFTKLQNIITGIGYKISKDIIIDYCGYCKDAFLLFTLENYYSSFLDKNSNPKYYFMDNGILNLFLDDKKSSLLENIVALKYKDSLYYLKGNKTDIDFYISNENTAIQVAYSLSDKEVYDREVNNLIEFAKNSKKKTNLFIITYEEERVLELGEYKIQVLPLAKYLLQNKEIKNYDCR